jgi:hypothetical protein
MSDSNSPTVFGNLQNEVVDCLGAKASLRVRNPGNMASTVGFSCSQHKQFWSKEDSIVFLHLCLFCSRAWGPPIPSRSPEGRSWRNPALKVGVR